MFSRTWLAVLAGSLALWGMSRLGGVSLPEQVGSEPPVLTARSSAAAAEALPALAACLEDVAALDPDAAGSDVLPVAGRYARWCRPLVDGEAFAAFSLVYGERSRAVVLAILEREQRLAAEVAADPRRGTLAPDVIWAAALRRAAADVRVFDAELSGWFDAWSPVRTGAVGGGPASHVAAAGR